MANKYDADLYLKYNNYGFSDKSIADVKTYLANQTLPISLNTSQKRTRFKQKWSKDWEVRSNKLVYTLLNLTVVPDGERNTILKGIYEDIKTGVGQGIDVFYKRIRDKYLNIRRSDVSAFLKSQKVYQITRPQNHIINKPILVRLPAEHKPVAVIVAVSKEVVALRLPAEHKPVAVIVAVSKEVVALRLPAEHKPVAVIVPASKEVVALRLPAEHKPVAVIVPASKEVVALRLPAEHKPVAVIGAVSKGVADNVPLKVVLALETTTPLFFK
jgi:hypothetical protein